MKRLVLSGNNKTVKEAIQLMKLELTDDELIKDIIINCDKCQECQQYDNDRRCTFRDDKNIPSRWLKKMNSNDMTYALIHKFRSIQHRRLYIHAAGLVH